MRHAPAPTRLATRFVAAACAALALLAAALVLDAPRTLAEDPAECETIDLGVLGGDTTELGAEGTWSTEDCDSRFLPDSDAHTYRFELPETTWVHIDLASPTGDSYLHLLTGDGGRIAHNDDGGRALDARIERQLAAGTYLVEAAAGDGRARGPADFALEIFIAEACEPVDLGVLEPGVTLTAEETWAHDDCGARYREDTPAHTYRFELPEDGTVRIDLQSDDGDPYLFLLTPDGSYIYSDDDGGTNRDSRIENDLAAGSYLIEATTYLDRDSVFTSSPFTVTVSLVDESKFSLKIEAISFPDTVIAGEPFDVHYRVGNLGDLDLPADGSTGVVYAVGSWRAFNLTDHVAASEERWRAGVSYHSGPETASALSTSIPEFGPLSLVIRRPGVAWLSVGVVAENADDEEIGIHRVSVELDVLSGPTFDTLIVSVDGEDYYAAAPVDEDGIVTYSAYLVADPAAELDAGTSAKAIYAAATQTLVLDGIFDRPAIALLGEELATSEGLQPEPLDIRSPSSTNLLNGFAWHYGEALAGSGLAESVAAGNVLVPAAVEDLVLASADGILAHIAPMLASWTAADDRVGEGESLTFGDALAIQSELAYAETRGYPLVAAGRAVRAARASDAGWADPAVRAMLGGLAVEARCADAPTLGEALTAIGAEDIEETLALDARLREALPAHALATDAALCAIGGIDASNTTFLRRLTIAGSEVHAMIAPTPPPAAEPEADLEPEPLRVRIVARLAEDGRIEHGVHVVGGGVILPQRRFFDAPPDDRRWYFSSDVEAAGGTIGVVRARRLDDGRIEMGFRDAASRNIAPDVRYLPFELPPGAWLPSSEFEAPRPAPAEEPEA